MNVWWIDLWRIITAAMGASVTVLIFLVLLCYVPSIPRRPKSSLLKIHIICIGISYMLLAIGNSLDMWVRFHIGMSWRLPLLFIAFCFANFAMFIMIYRLFVKDEN